MSANFNKVILVGNLTRDPEISETHSGKKVASLRMAINDRRKTQTGEWVDDPTYVDVTLFDREAEVAQQYLSQGSSVLIDGRLKFEEWKDKQTGASRNKLKVICQRMQMLGGRDGAREGGATRRRDEFVSDSPESDASFAPSGGAQEDDIPF